MDELTADERVALEERIAQERERAVARIAALEHVHDDIVAASADAVRDDEHDPEGATIAFERAQVASLLTAARERLYALTRAEARLEQPGAARCERCGRPIGLERLHTRPESTACVGCAQRPPGG